MKKFFIPVALFAIIQTTPAQSEILDIDVDRTIETYTLTASSIRISDSTMLVVNPNQTVSAIRPKLELGNETFFISDEGTAGAAGDYFCAILGKNRVGYKLKGPYSPGTESLSIEDGMISSIQAGGHIYETVTCD